MTREQFQQVAPNATKATREANGFFCDEELDATARKIAKDVAEENAGAAKVIREWEPHEGSFGSAVLTLEAEVETPTIRSADTSPLSFFLDCLPPTITAQQKGAFIVPPAKGTTGKGTIRFFTKVEVIKAERQLTALLKPYAPRTPREGPIRLSVTFSWPWRAGEPLRNRRGVRWKDTQPDASNLIKGLEDCMTRCGFWHNDGQIADLRVAKGWSDKPGIAIAIESLDSHTEGRSCKGQPDGESGALIQSEAK